MPIRKTQFSLKAVLLSFICVAIGMAVAARIWRHYFQLPYHAHVNLAASCSLDSAVQQLNRQLGMYAMPAKLALKKSEIVAVLKGQNTPPGTSADSAAQVRAACEQILRQDVLPAGSELEMSRLGVATLQIPFTSATGYRFIIRHPGVYRRFDGTTSMNWDWQPNPEYQLTWHNNPPGWR